MKLSSLLILILFGYYFVEPPTNINKECSKIDFTEHGYPADQFLVSPKLFGIWHVSDSGLINTDCLKLGERCYVTVFDGLFHGNLFTYDINNSGINLYADPKFNRSHLYNKRGDFIIDNNDILKVGMPEYDSVKDTLITIISYYKLNSNTYEYRRNDTLLGEFSIDESSIDLVKESLKKCEKW